MAQRHAGLFNKIIIQKYCGLYRTKSLASSSFSSLACDYLGADWEQENTMGTRQVIFFSSPLCPHPSQLSQAVAEGNCCFGTIDTWLLYKLTKGRFPHSRVCSCTVCDCPSLHVVFMYISQLIDCVCIFKLCL